MGHSDTRVRTLDTAPNDELSTPDHLIEECTCGVLFRVGEAHRCGHVGEWVSWKRYQDRQEGR